MLQLGSKKGNGPSIQLDKHIQIWKKKWFAFTYPYKILPYAKPAMHFCLKVMFESVIFGLAPDFSQYSCVIDIVVKSSLATSSDRFWWRSN